MSSHHIVRDEQEPAFLLWQPGQLSFGQAGELLEWSPRIVVHQQAMEEALAWGIKLDAVWAVPAQLKQTTAAVAHQQPVTVLSFTQEAALREVLQWLKNKNQQSVNLLANAEAQDYVLLQQLEPLQPLVQVQVISRGWRYSFFGQGAAQKWLPAESPLRLISFGQKPSAGGIPFSVLKENEQTQEVLLQQSGVVKIKSTAAFWIGELL